jgi:rhamnose utilization protein RhaD (predicted bifunctional aldolase and dehydrogenase)
MDELRQRLWTLTRTLGEPARDLVVIGEGNTSARVDSDTFLIKASGQQMQTMEPEGLVAVRFAPILEMLNADPPPTLEEQKAIARAAKLDPDAPDPSIEVSFHALLLSECRASFIGHTHPTPILSILCSPRAKDFAERRTFPDEAVLCGPRSAYVPYADPGLPLAHAIRRAVREFHGRRYLAARDPAGESRADRSGQQPAGSVEHHHDGRQGGTSVHRGGGFGRPGLPEER